MFPGLSDGSGRLVGELRRERGPACVVLPVIELAWKRFSRPVSRSSRNPERVRGLVVELACGVAVDRVDDDTGAQNDRQPQTDLELVVLSRLVERRAARRACSRHPPRRTEACSRPRGYSIWPADIAFA